MKLKSIVKGLSIVILIIGCKDEKPSDLQEEEYTGQLKIKDSVSIEIDKNTFYDTKQTHVLKQADTVYLFREDYLSSTVDILNWNSKTIGKPLSFSKMANFGGSAFYPITKDSVFIASLSGQVALSVNDSLKVLKSPSLKGKPLRFYGLNKHKPVKIDDEIFMTLGSDYLQTDSNFKDRPLIVSYNIKTGELKDIGFHYPPEFYNYYWTNHQFNPTFTKNHKNQLVLSLETSPDLYIYNATTGLIITKNNVSKSAYFGNIEPYGNFDGILEDIGEITYFEYLKGIGRYRGIIYDPNENIYYRIVSLPSDEEIDNQRTQDWVAQLSIMVLDENFKLLTERKLPNRTYNPEDYFLTEKGLWISTNNELSNSFDENRLSYTLFNFDK